MLLPRTCARRGVATAQRCASTARRYTVSTPLRNSQSTNSKDNNSEPKTPKPTASKSTQKNKPPKERNWKTDLCEPPLHAEKVIFSGIQPTGIPHLGNYLGALRQWVDIQNSSEKSKTILLFSVVDLHAITAKHDPAKLRKYRQEMLASLMAVGLDSSKSFMFCQSSVSAHSELMWLLSCTASMGYLSRMTQWKSKMGLPDTANPLEPTSPDPKSREALKLGLFSYPVLQAADILLYGTTHVPVGEDQAQHLEFTRQLAISFNKQYNKPLLTPPETILSPAKRVMSLVDPTKKMSKSDPNPNSRILITDSEEVIKKKINSARTDSIEGVSYDRENRPGVSNLIDLMYYMDESVAESPAKLAEGLAGLSMRQLKEEVSRSVEKGIKDVRERYEGIMEREGKKKEGFLADFNEESARRVNGIAKNRLRAIKRAVGLGGLRV